MGKITRAFCDRCEKELDINEYYYSTDTISQNEVNDKAREVLKGDFCQECFKEIMKKELNINE